MAKKTHQRGKCKNCAHARDFHTKNWKGEFFLCRCDYQSRSMFINIEGCDMFKPK